MDFKDGKRGAILTKEQAAAMTDRVRALARAGRFQLAPQEKISAHPEILNKFLELILQHPEALVTDESYIGDYLNKSDWDGTRYEYILARTNAEFGVNIEPIIRQPLHEIISFIAQSKLI